MFPCSLPFVFPSMVIYLVCAQHNYLSMDSLAFTSLSPLDNKVHTISCSISQWWHNQPTVLRLLLSPPNFLPSFCLPTFGQNLCHIECGNENRFQKSFSNFEEMTSLYNYVWLSQRVLINLQQVDAQKILLEFHCLSTCVFIVLLFIEISIL